MAGIQFTGLATGLDTEAIITEMMKLERTKIDTVEKDKQLIEWKKEAWQEMNQEIYDFYTDDLFDMKLENTYLQKKSTTSNSNILDVSAGTSAALGTHTITVDQLATGASLVSKDITDNTITTTSNISFTMTDGSNVELIELNSGSTIEDFVSAINTSDLEIIANYDEANNRIFMNSKNTGENTDIQIQGISTTAGNADYDFLTGIGFSVNASGNILATEATDDDGSSLGTTGQNSQYTYNGVSLESDSNQVSVNNLSLTLKSITEVNEEVNITITQDTDAIYNKIKNMITSYNELIEKIDEKYSAEYVSPKIKPLTDEEKEEMSESEIELWEGKIKTSILRSDSILAGVKNSMKGIFTLSEGVDTSSLGTYKYLSDLGIVSANYTEKGKLHIMGDEDDKIYNLSENKLREAIENNPEDVASLMSAVAEEMYSTLGDKMKSNDLSSALTIYNDKMYTEDMREMEQKIETMEDRFAAIEQRYYSQFAKLEVAISNMNSQSSALAGLMPA